jgi:hypothetical protein
MHLDQTHLLRKQKTKRKEKERRKKKTITWTPEDHLFFYCIQFFIILIGGTLNISSNTSSFELLTWK